MKIKEYTHKTWIILPLLFFAKYPDGTKEITFGWLRKTYFIKF